MVKQRRARVVPDRRDRPVTTIPNPENQNKAWFFKGEESVSVCWEPGPVNDILLDGPTLITEGWASLKAAGFETVEAFLPNAQFPDQPWVFSGERYARISISAGTVLSGPSFLKIGLRIVKPAS